MSRRNGMDRREAVRWMLSAVTSVALFDRDAFAQTLDPMVVDAKGYGLDPDLLKSYTPGTSGRSHLTARSVALRPHCAT